MALLCKDQGEGRSLYEVLLAVDGEGKSLLKSRYAHPRRRRSRSLYENEGSIYSLKTILSFNVGASDNILNLHTRLAVGPIKPILQ